MYIRLFVYKLVTECLYDKTVHPDLNLIRAYKASLLKNKETIEVNDLGAGSKRMKRSKRVIAQIARHNTISVRKAGILYNLIHYFKPDNILELGTSLGVGSYTLALANPKAKVTTIEGCHNIAATASTFLNKHPHLNIQLRTGDFLKVIKELTNQTFDLVYFDGNHQKEPTLLYFETLLPAIHNDTVFIMDDIYWSEGMTEAWKTIKAHPMVTVTVDVFHFGFVFFRKEQAKEHFTIRL